jgi:hypothetical protein
MINRWWQRRFAVGLVAAMGGTMAVAPQVMAWQQRMANCAGPFAPTMGHEAPLGTPFLADEFGPDARLAVLIGFGADPSVDPPGWVMTDVSTDLLQSVPVRIQPGRADEQSQAQPAQLAFTLKNDSGDYTPRRPGGRYWPHVHVGIPVQVTADTGGTGPVDRFTGFIDGIYPAWDTTGRYAVVRVTAKGVLNRVGQGAQPLRSPLTRAVLAAGPRLYWPMEDGSNATQGASALAANPIPLAASGTVAFAALDPLTAGQSSGITVTPGTTFGFTNLPQFKAGGSLSAAFGAGSATAWGIQAAIFNARDTADLATVFHPLRWRTSDSATWDLYFDYTATNTIYVNYNGVTVASLGGALIFNDVRVDVAQSGANISVTISRLYAGSASGTTAGTLYGVTSVAINPDNQTSTGDYGVGHLRIWDGNSFPDFQTADLISAFWGYPGEGCWTRFLRLCAEEGIPAAISTGATSGGRAMGAQTIDTLSNLLRECEQVDGGVMADG